MGKDHPLTFGTRSNIASGTGRTGDAQEALRLLRELLPDEERVMGKDHRLTLITRGNIANWTGKTGDAREALRFSLKLLPDLKRILGKDHPDTLTTRGDIAHWTGHTGRALSGARGRKAFVRLGGVTIVDALTLGEVMAIVGEKLDELAPIP